MKFLYYEIRNFLYRIYLFIGLFNGKRLNIFFTLSLLIVLVYGFRLVNLCITNRDYWLKVAGNQYKGILRLSSERGEILDRNGALLAASERVYSIYVRPLDIKDKKLFLEIVSGNKNLFEKFANKDGIANERIEILRNTIAKLGLNDNLGPILQSKRHFVWLKRDVNINRKTLNRDISYILKIYYTFSGENPYKKDLPDIIGAIPEFTRVYPYMVGSTVIGTTNRNGKGLSGLEYYLEKNGIILGKEFYIKGKRDAIGNLYINTPTADTFLAHKKGNNVVTTIDGNIQYYVEKTLESYAKKLHPKFINAVLMNINTGEVIAAASYPLYHYSERRNKNFLSEVNPRFITDPYEPGSVIKPIIMAGAINDNLITPETIIKCPRHYRVDDKVFHNEFRKDVKLKAWEIIKYSDDVGIVKVAQKLGKEETYRYLKAFGFGNKTGIELPGESPGVLRNYKNWRDVDFATISFGHDIMATTLQLAAAYCTLVNGGYYVKPRLLMGIENDRGNMIKEFQSIRRRVISKGTSETMRRILSTVVEGGTGKATRFLNFYVDGKTGTSRKWEGGRYSRKRIDATFVGAFPGTRPKYVLAISVDEPKLKRNMLWASKIAVPIFRDIAERVILYERLTPDRKLYTFTSNGTLVARNINANFPYKDGIQR